MSLFSLVLPFFIASIGACYTLRFLLKRRFYRVSPFLLLGTLFALSSLSPLPTAFFLNLSDHFSDSFSELIYQWKRFTLRWRCGHFPMFNIHTPSLSSILLTLHLCIILIGMVHTSCRDVMVIQLYFQLSYFYLNFVFRFPTT